MLIPLVLIFFGIIYLLQGLGIIFVADFGVYVAAAAILVGVHLFLRTHLLCMGCDHPHAHCACKKIKVNKK